jgi:hypothetical protein
MAKRRVLLIYGEKTTQINFRVPESKKEKIIKEVDELLKKYHDPKHVSIDVKDSTTGKRKIEKHIQDEVDVFISSKTEKPPKKIEPQVVEEYIQTDEDLQYDKDYAEYEKEGYEKLTTFPLGAKTIRTYCGYPIISDGKYYYTKYVDKNKDVVIVKFKKEQHAEFYILDELPRKTK